jgi:hypothetical protein
MASNSVDAALDSSQVRLICGIVTPKWIGFAMVRLE